MHIFNRIQSQDKKILETGSQKELNILQMKTLMSLEAKVAALQTLIAKRKKTYQDVCVYTGIYFNNSEILLV